MTIDCALQAAKDFWRPNHDFLKEYVIRDGRKHPCAIICPGGAYSMVCSFVEGLPYAKRLNEQGYSAFVLYYRCRKKARYNSSEYAAMVELLGAIQEKWGITVIDLWSDGDFNAITPEQRELYLVDAIHSTKAGYLEWWTPYMENVLCETIGKEQ